MLPRKAVKIICIVLAILMALSAVAALTAVFAVDTSPVAVVSPVTGDNDLDYIIPIALIAAAILAVVVCLVLPKMKKKN